MSIYVPVQKEIISSGNGPPIPLNGIINLHKKTLRPNGDVIHDTSRNYPNGKYIDLNKNPAHVAGQWIAVSRIQPSLLDEIMQMLPGEKSKFTYLKDDIVDNIFFAFVGDDDIIVEVELITWEGEDISDKQDKSLIKVVLDEGTSASKPFWTGKCIIILREGDSTKEIVFRAGDGQTYGVNPQVERCVMTMTKNERCTLTHYPSGREYIIKLKSLEKWKYPHTLEVEGVMEGAATFKEQGNNAFRAGKFQLARFYYQHSLDYLDTLPGEYGLSLMQTVNLNLAQVLLREEEPCEARRICGRVLWNEPDNIKGLYRRASAHKALGDYELAMMDIDRLLELDPTNTEAQRLRLLIFRESAASTRKEQHNLRQVINIMTEVGDEVDPNDIIKTAWEIADETCPPELQSFEAYDKYKQELDDEQKRLKEEDQKRQQEYNAANPPKKKKKKKKKKKNTNAIEIAETEAVPEDPGTLPDNDVEPAEQEVIDDLKYEVASEKTIVKRYDESLTGDTQNHPGLPPVNEDHLESEQCMSNVAVTTPGDLPKQHTNSENANEKTCENNVVNNENDLNNVNVTNTMKDPQNGNPENSSISKEVGATSYENGTESAIENVHESEVPNGSDVLGTSPGCN